MEVDLQVISGGRQHETFSASGDPEDLDWLQYQLRSWLKREHWPERTWNEFEIKSRRHGESRVVKTAKAV